MHYSIQDFIQLIAQLRNPNGGCPWDLKQNYESMIPCLTEETYEVIDAIQKKDIANLREELGDLLLQVVFFSQLASEDGYFTFDDVLNDISKKIVRRHPHVFGDATAGNEEEALARWNSIKAQEKSVQEKRSILDDIPNAFPALLRAQKMQKQCSKIGFDWDELEPVLAKVEEELQEVRDEINQTLRNQEKIEEENALCHFNYFSSLFTSSHRISISIKERSLTDEPRSTAFSSTLRKRCSNLLFALRKASSALHLR